MPRRSVTAALLTAACLAAGSVAPAQAASPPALMPVRPLLHASTPVFLPNLDDDGRRCAKINADCSDASDQIVNGAADAADLAPIITRPAPGLPADATGTIRVTRGAGKIHLFARSPGAGASGWTLVTDATKFSAAQLRQGLRLGLEGTDIMRDPAVWDGRATIDLAVTASGSTTTSSVTLRVAPLLTTNHTMPAEQVLVAKPGKELTSRFERFNRRLGEEVTRAGVPDGLRQVGGPFLNFMQDAFEQMYVEMPTAAGAQRLSLLMQPYAPDEWTTGIVTLRRPGVGVIWAGKDIGTAGGNIETIPPYTAGGVAHPHGRVVIGVRPGNPEADAFVKLLADQGTASGRAQGAPLTIDVSQWAVGHVDETIQFLPADTPRGWRMAVADPEGALNLLRLARSKGLGNERLVTNPAVDGYPDLSPRINAALISDRLKIVPDNLRAAATIERNVAKIKAATGITDAEIVHIPVLFRRTTEKGAPLVAQLPDALNSVLLDRHTVLAGLQFTVKLDGTDLFGDAVRRAYRSVGVDVRWIDDFTSHFFAAGDVHCATNVFRRLG